jgi:hypothetical protein
MLAGMQIPTWLGWLDPVIRAVTDWLTTYGQPLLFGAGATGALLALALVWRFLRTGEVHEKLGWVAVTLATLFAMEGMYEVARGPLGLNVAGSLMFCATFEVVMLHQGSLAAHKLAAALEGPAPDISRHMRFVWLVAVASGVIASTASSSITEVVLRLTTPPLAAGIWYMSLYADVEPAERQPSRWIWTPQRIGVRLGLLKPGTGDDLTEVFRQRTVRRIVDAAVIVWQAERTQQGSEPQQLDDATARRVDRAARRLDQLAKGVDEETMAAAQRQLRLALGIRQQLFAGIGPDGGPVRDLSEDERLTLERFRLDTHSLAGGLRDQAAEVAAVEQHRVVHGVRMPAHIADQIPDQIPAAWVDRFRTKPVDHPGGPDRTTDVDQAADRVADQTTEPWTTPVDQLVGHGSGPDWVALVDQPVTSGSVPAARTTRARRTTVRVDQVKPISPAAGGAVPPRVEAMVQALREAYPDDIPARRTVMPAMGWTNAQDAQTAINLVRAERTKTTATTKES